MEGRRERSALSTRCHVGTSEVPDHAPPKHVGQPRPVSRLMRPAPVRIVRERLSVEGDGLARHVSADRNMGILDGARCFLDPFLALPAPQGGTDGRAVRIGVGVEGGLSERVYAMPVGSQDSRIDAVQRRARHRAEDFHLHPLPLPRSDR